MSTADIQATKAVWDCVLAGRHSRIAEAYMRRNLVGLLVFVCALAALSPAVAQPTITSPPPASGGSPSAALVFTFSEAMEPDLSGVDFVDLTTFATLPTTAVWSGGNKVLTCTPTPAFPANRMIVWSAYGENPSGAALEGTT